jgi:hypothetical protein
MSRAAASRYDILSVMGHPMVHVGHPAWAVQLLLKWHRRQQYESLHFTNLLADPRAYTVSTLSGVDVKRRNGFIQISH